ncbi:MAG: phosphoribosyltransferase family protein [Burkholderiaceae bacterium]|nr:phosphoribosyltransferase family protein [Burkholderiaceae bacterium]
MTRFADRTDAGRQLAPRLVAMHLADPVVLALPRGGVPVAAEIARALHAPLDLLLVRKIGVPWQPELAVAAVIDGERPDVVVDEKMQQAAGIAQEYIDRQAARELEEIERRRRLYLGQRAAVAVHGCTAIVVDDGIATGTSMRAALRALRRRGPARLLLAVPVAPPDTIARLRSEVDDIVCLAQPTPFMAIGPYYDDFHQLADAEVTALIRELDAERAALPAAARAATKGAP